MANGQPAGCKQPRTEISRGKLKVSYPISHRYSMWTNPSFESDLPEVVHGRDVFAQLPTGFGKSLTF